MIGYHTSYDHNLVGMAMTQGRREDVVNIGIGIKEIVSPPGMTYNDFAISLYHRVRRPALAFPAPGIVFFTDATPPRVLRSLGHS